MNSQTSQAPRTLAMLVILLALALSVTLATPMISVANGATASIGRRATPYPTFPYPPPVSGLSYDEQAGVTFAQDLSRLDFNATAIAQTGPDGDGPAYLVNGLTGAGYWYQIGLSWKWPSTDGSTLSGFSMNYEVFNQYGQSIFPRSGGGGIDSLNVNPGDIVLLSLSFASSSVVMQATDWNTTSSATESYSAQRASTFVGLSNAVSQNGFFSGLMTEEYHSGPYYGAGVPVFYTDSRASFSSAWMWMDEWDTNSGYNVFNDNTNSPVQLHTTPAEYFSSNGTAELANSHGLVTGLTPVVYPDARGETAYGQPGHQTDATIQITEPQGAIVRFLNVTITASFSNYTSTSPTAFTFQGSTGHYPLTFTLPSGLPIGSYILSVQVTSWQYLDPQANEWIDLPSTSFNETLVVSNIPHYPSPQSPGPGSGSGPGSGQGPGTTGDQGSQTLLSRLNSWIIPLALVYAVGVSAALIVIRTERRQRNVSASQNPTTCSRCGSAAAPGSSFCQECGASLHI